MNAVMNHVGDAIASLQVDQDGNKPPPAQAVMNLIDKLQTSNSNQPQPQGNMLRCVKYAGILTIIFAILTLPFIQSMFDKMFSSSWAKVGVQALVFFIVTVIILYTVSKHENKPKTA